MSRFSPVVPALEPNERLFYRNRLRDARYAALADAEGFGAICFALEALGLRLLGEKGALGSYMDGIKNLARSSPTLNELTTPFPSKFKPFDALYANIRTARNDAMHTGAYARHATREAIELCIGLEDALMSGVAQTVGNLMVSTAIAVEPWQPVAHARQLMLMHSFSFLPVRMDGTWHLVSELGLAKYLRNGLRNSRLAESLETAKGNGMELVSIHDTQLLQVGMKVEEVLSRAQVQQGPMLWLVVEDGRPDHLAGVLSPFELM